ncbi:condensin complex protein MksE [Methylocaldum sp. MU1018]
MFENTVKRLLRGEFICEVSADECFRYLKDPEHRREVEAFLDRLGYALASTGSQLAYYAAYRQIDGEARSDIRKLFQTFRLELHPVVEWLDMMMQCQQQDAALSPGDTLSFSGLLKTIENNQALADRLQGFARFRDFLSTEDSTKGRLEKLLKTLCHWGYLHLASRDTLVYQVTGKLDYFYQALQFIQEHEALPLEQKEEDTQQDDLF